MRRRQQPAFAAPAPPSNSLRITVDASVSFEELASWPAATSRAFLLGVAEVLAVQKAVAT